MMHSITRSRESRDARINRPVQSRYGSAAKLMSPWIFQHDFSTTKSIGVEPVESKYSICLSLFPACGTGSCAVHVSRTNTFVHVVTVVLAPGWNDYYGRNKGQTKTAGDVTEKKSSKKKKTIRSRPSLSLVNVVHC